MNTPFRGRPPRRRQFRRYFRLPWRSANQIRADVDEELAFHLDMRVDALVACGLTPDAARAQALREFGDIEDARHYLGHIDRDIEAAQRRSDLMHELWQDIVYAARKLRAAPGFTLAAVVTLALGIGATTAIFSVVNATLLRPLPFPQADHLVRVKFTQQGHGDAGTPMDLIDYGTQAKDFVGFAVGEGTTANLSREQGEAERLISSRVSPSWFDLLRVRPLYGRFFQAGDDAAGAPDVAVISEELWRRDFSADPSVIGRQVRIDARPFTIVGVVPTGERYPLTADVWMPKRWDPGELSDHSRGARWLTMLARVKDGVSVAAANAEVYRISQMMETRYPEDYRERRAQLLTVQNFLVGDVRKPLLVILGAVGFVLLIACANVANLLLVRATARESEIAVRAALGAGRGRIVRQLVTESVLLALLGAVAGVVVARAGMSLLLSRAPDTITLLQKATLDGTTLAVTAIVAILTGIIFGALPAFHASKPQLAQTLRAGGRGALGRPSANRTKRIIVATELALAVMLLSGAGLLLRSFTRLMAVDPGFRPEGVLSMKVTLPATAYDSSAQRAFVQSLEARVRALPGVTAADVADDVPMDGSARGWSLSVRGQTYARPSDQPGAYVRIVGPEFFRAIGIPVLRGRGFAESDIAAAPHVFVVNQAFVKRVLHGQDAVGQRMRLDWGEDAKGSYNEIVGVVGDVRERDLAADPKPTVYAAFPQYPTGTLTIVARTGAAPATLAAPIRNILRELDHDLPVFSVQTMEDRVAGSVAQQRFYATLIGAFAVVALVLAAVGLYGVIAFTVGQRTHELGVRVALGASGERIVRMVIGEGLAITAVGVGVGLVAALLAGRVISTLLYGVTAHDPVTLGAVAVALAVVAALASWLPARRAAGVDPLTAMRGE